MEENQILEKNETLKNNSDPDFGLTQDEKDCLACNFSCIQGCV